MANKELDKLLEGYFAPKNSTFGLDQLQGLIKEIYIESQLRAINEVNKLYEKDSKKRVNPCQNIHDQRDSVHPNL